MVSMNNIVTRVEVRQFPDGHTVTAGEKALYAELVVAVKDLVVSVNGYPQVMIGKALVKVEQEGGELNCRVSLLKNFLQALLLDITLGNDKVAVSLLHVRD